MPITAEDVEHALLVRDLAIAYEGFFGKGNAQWSARDILTAIALKKKIPFGTNAPAMFFIKRKHPPLWERIAPYRT